MRNTSPSSSASRSRAIAPCTSQLGAPIGSITRFASRSSWNRTSSTSTPCPSRGFTPCSRAASMASSLAIAEILADTGVQEGAGRSSAAMARVYPALEPKPAPKKAAMIRSTDSSYPSLAGAR